MDASTTAPARSGFAITSPQLSDTSLTPSSPTKNEAVVTASAGIQPRLLPFSSIDNASLRAHRSKLPLSLYLLSFAPPIRGERKDGVRKTSWREFFSHPYVLYTLGTLAALPAGLAFPALDLLYGYWTTGVTALDASQDHITGRGDQVGWIMTVVGFLILFLTWAFSLCFSTASHNLTQRLRHQYVASVMVQDAAFFEKTGPGEISTRASKDVTAIRTAFGEKLGYLIWSLSTIIAAITSSFANSPKLAGVLFAVIPFVVLIFGFFGWLNDIVGGPANNLEGQTSSLVEQILSSVRIVQSFNMGGSLIKRFDGDLLKRLQKLGAKRSIIRSLEQSSVYFALFLTYSLAFWFGGIQVRGGLETGHVLTAFFNYVNILFTLANIVPHITSIADAMVSLKEIRRQIEREPFIDVRDESGEKLPETGWAPSFALEHVTFAYPSRPTIPALNDVSVTIETGTVTAFVGPSGSGKSTTASLLLREYDPETANIPNPNDPKTEDKEDAGDGKDIKQTEKARRVSSDIEKAATPTEGEELVKGAGKVYFAGRDIREYNLRWLRSQVAVVSQNPQLFTATVFENVAAGLTGTDFEYRPDIDGAEDAPPEIKARTAKIRELCSEAMQKAQAWQFVSKLPKGMDTMIAGGRTGVLSGGQRQRLAIARALVRKPACMLLDEATSALDADTEEKIRLMLEQELAERGMTTILIAHRLSTVAKAGRIIVMKDGRVVDQGRYEELMDKNRPDQTFRQLAITQRADPDVADDNVPEDSMYKEKETLEGEWSAIEPLPVGPIGRDQPITSAFSTSDQTAVDSTRHNDGQHLHPAHIRKASSISRLKRPDIPWTASGRGSTMFQHEHGLEDAASVLHRNTSRNTALTDGEDVEQAVSPEMGKEERRQSFQRFLKLVKSQKWFFLIGTLGGIIAGGSFPIAGWMTGKAVHSLSDAYANPGINTWALWFLILAIIDLVIYFVNAFYLEVASENIMRKLKRDSLETLIKQEIGFFDQEDSSAGGLTSAVSSHPANVGAATGLVSAQVLISVTNLIGSILMGLIIDWKIALVCLPPILILFFSGWLNVAMLERYENVTSIPATKAASYVNEVTDSIKTVAALGRERETMRVFDVQAKAAPKRGKYLFLGSGGSAVGQAMILLMAALIFYWASQRLADGAPVDKVFAVFEAVIIAAFSGSRLFTFVGDYGRAVNSFKAIQIWLRRKPKYSTYSAPTSAGEIEHDWASGDIVLNHVEMRYPQRPNHPALKDISLRIGAGKTHAFCGTSGSGKSSIFALLQRFYDPSRGTISFGGVDHRQLPLDDLRANMAYVSQDPVLFEGTIRWNLSLGSLDPSSVMEDEIKAACEQAYIWDFVCGLEKGLDTEIGMKGASLSGGQRQRLCIARALIRNPKILLLDEATSALDAQSEKSVQMALDNASKGRTTVTIAHRLSTIRRSDVIHVIEDGYVKETGSHKELLRKRGRYFELVQAQL
ncbi:hypothetical protein NliqN6_5786 [Naganishia liquefaciens]|uniref:ATP-binding cassette domain-containing protein n=1 Tax=Naganishia liquefaciens TaxID=104408 RepID=A0A8H3TYD1_9TREE|nr:hypothetical protein NliqN6_5786 [Naganishia liquefaciens]